MSVSLSSLGEFGLIERLADVLPGAVPDEMRIGIGDDAAAYQAEGVHVISTDLLADGTHFLRAKTPSEAVGYKSVAVSVSDILAMNALPFLATIAIALPNDASVEEIESIYRGVSLAASDYGVWIAGGDTTASRTLTISVTMVGRKQASGLVQRSGARPEDLIVVTCALGTAYAGLQVLLQNLENEFPAAVQHLAWPKPPISLVRDWSRCRVHPSAMIDMSDGPLADLAHLCRQSDCGACIDIARVPISTVTREVAARLGEKAIDYALYGGDEYGLLFTVSESEFQRMDQDSLNVIGCMKEPGNGITLSVEGQQVQADMARCFAHFARVPNLPSEQVRRP